MIDGQQYYNYFLHQAETHPELLHAEDNLAFAQVSVEEAFGDLRSDDVTDGYLMRLIVPVFRLAPGPNMPEQTYDGGFLIAKSWDSKDGGTPAYNAALWGSERVAVDIIEKMYADSNAGHPMFQGRAHSDLTLSVRERPTVGDGTHAGMLVLWSLPNYFTYCTPAESVAWTDQGLTPFAE